MIARTGHTDIEREMYAGVGRAEERSERHARSVQKKK